MTLPDTHDPTDVSQSVPPSRRARKGLASARRRYERSWLGDLVAQLKELQFFDWTMVFGAELLWSALPLLIILSSLANHRLDSDISRHIGLDTQGARIVSTLFRSTPSHAALAILTGALFSLAGVVSAVASLQVMYERLFRQAARGWRDLPRYFVWMLALFAILAFEASLDRSERNAGGTVLQALLTFVVTAAFFMWTMHFLLAGRVPWRNLVRPTLISALLWIAFGFFSSLYFSSTLIDDSRTYGTIGVVFTLLTWFIVIGYVIVLGAALGAVWQRRATRTPSPALARRSA